MKTKKLEFELSNNLTELAKIFSKANEKLYIVGGFVRDILVGRTAYDIDICSALTLDKVIGILENTKYIVKVKNKNFGTAQIEIDDEIYEYTCFRKEIYDKTGSHSPKKVEFINSIVLDALRRDFYINALYYSILEKEIIDPLDKGMEDINNRIITVIKSNPHKFMEDATRILRMFKFCVQLNFDIDRTDFNSAKKYAYLINNVSRERKIKEINFLGSCSLEQQEKYCNLLKQCDICI